MWTGEADGSTVYMDHVHGKKGEGAGPVGPFYGEPWVRARGPERGMCLWSPWIRCRDGEGNGGGTQFGHQTAVLGRVACRSEMCRADWATGLGKK